MIDFNISVQIKDKTYSVKDFNLYLNGTPIEGKLSATTANTIIRELQTKYIANCAFSKIGVTSKKETLAYLHNIQQLQKAHDLMRELKKMGCDSDYSNTYVKFDESLCSVMAATKFTAQIDTKSISQVLKTLIYTVWGTESDLFDFHEQYNPITQDKTSLDNMYKELLILGSEQTTFWKDFSEYVNGVVARGTAQYNDICEAIEAASKIETSLQGKLVIQTDRQLTAKSGKLKIKESYWCTWILRQRRDNLKASGITATPLKLSKKEKLSLKHVKQMDTSELLWVFKNGNISKAQEALTEMTPEGMLTLFTDTSYENRFQQMILYIKEKIYTTLSISPELAKAMIAKACKGAYSIDSEVYNKISGSFTDEDILQAVQANSLFLSKEEFKVYADTLRKLLPVHKYVNYSSITSALEPLSKDEYREALWLTNTPWNQLKVNMTEALKHITYKEVLSLRKEKDPQNIFCRHLFIKHQDKKMMLEDLLAGWTLSISNYTTLYSQGILTITDIVDIVKQDKSLNETDWEMLREKDALILAQTLADLSRFSEINIQVINTSKVREICLNSKGIFTFKGVQAWVHILKNRELLKEMLSTKRLILETSQYYTSHVDAYHKEILSCLTREDLEEIYGDITHCPLVKYLASIMTYEEKVSLSRDPQFFRYNVEYYPYEFLCVFKNKKAFKECVGDLRNGPNNNFAKKLLGLLKVDNSIDFLTSLD